MESFSACLEYLFGKRILWRNKRHPPLCTFNLQCTFWTFFGSWYFCCMFILYFLHMKACKVQSKETVGKETFDQYPKSGSIHQIRGAGRQGEAIHHQSSSDHSCLIYPEMFSPSTFCLAPPSPQYFHSLQSAPHKHPAVSAVHSLDSRAGNEHSQR